MWGGPSQLETWDLKPDAPSEYRGPFSPDPHERAGHRHLRAVSAAGRAKLSGYSLVRSLHHKMSSHNDGSIEVLTGKTPRQADPTSTATIGASRLRHDRQPRARPAGQRPAAVRRHPAAAVHDAAGLPGAEPQGVRARRPVGAGLPAAEPVARGRPERHAAGRSPRASRAARSLSPRPRPRRDAGGDRPVPAAGVSAADQPAGRRGVRPGPRRPAAARSLRPAPVGPELPAGPPAGRGRRRRHHHRRAGPGAGHAALLQLGRSRQRRSPAGTWPRACAGGPRSWTRPCRR